MVCMTMIVLKDNIANQKDKNEEWCDDNENYDVDGDDSVLYNASDGDKDEKYGVKYTHMANT